MMCRSLLITAHSSPSVLWEWTEATTLPIFKTNSSDVAFLPSQRMREDSSMELYARHILLIARMGLIPFVPFIRKTLPFTFDRPHARAGKNISMKGPTCLYVAERIVGGEKIHYYAYRHDVSGADRKGS
jgi:hypothetical protein